LSYLISSFSSLISLIKELIAFWMTIFISSILNIFDTFDIVDVGVDADAEVNIDIDLLDLLDLLEIDRVSKNKIKL
jgi:hypothetical protein